MTKALKLATIIRSLLFDLRRSNLVCDNQAFRSTLFTNNVIRVKIILSSELAEHAVSEGTKAESVSRSDVSFYSASLIILAGKHFTQLSSQPLRSRLVVFRIPSLGISEASLEKAFKY